METPTPKIYEAISLVMSGIKAIGKNRKNEQQNYKFRGIDDVYNELHDLFAEHKVFCTSEVTDFVKEERVNAKGTTIFYIYNKVKYTFWTVDGSSVTTTSTGEAMDSGDKASNKAMSSAHKVALLQMFMIPTEGDNDTENHSPEVQPKKSKMTEDWLHEAFKKVEDKHFDKKAHADEQKFIETVKAKFEVTDEQIEAIKTFYQGLAPIEPVEETTPVNEVELIEEKTPVQQVEGTEATTATDKPTLNAKKKK